MEEKKRKLGESIWKHPFVFLISFGGTFWWFFFYRTAFLEEKMREYLPVFHYHIGFENGQYFSFILQYSLEAASIIFIVGGLAVSFLLSWVLTAWWEGFCKWIRGAFWELITILVVFLLYYFFIEAVIAG